MTDTEPMTLADKVRALRYPLEGRRVPAPSSPEGRLMQGYAMGLNAAARLVESEARATPGLDAERLARALDTTYDIDGGPVRLALISPDGFVWTTDEAEYEHGSRIANSVAAEYDRLVTHESSIRS